MRSRFLAKSLMILLLACMCSAIKAENAEPEAPASLGTLVFITPQQTEAVQIMLPKLYPYTLTPSAGHSSYGYCGGELPRLDDTSTGLFEVLRLRGWANVMTPIVCYRRGIDLPPVGSPASAPYFKDVNKKIKAGELHQTIFQVMRVLFQGEPGLGNVEFSNTTQEIRQSVLVALLKNRLLKQNNVPTTAIVVRNHAVFGQDFYKLWLLTDVRIYKVQTLEMMFKTEVSAETEQYSIFASFHDLRDYFEIQEPEKESERNKFIIDFWTRDGGKVYFDAVSRLAGENAEMIKRIMLDQPPSPLNPVESAQTAAIIAFNELENEPEPEKAERTRTRRGRKKHVANPEKELEKLASEKREEQIADGGRMYKMGTVRRKIYMLAKEYEYAFLASIIDSTPERIIALDSDFNVYYSLPRDKAKLIMAADMDPKEYSPIVREWLLQSGYKLRKKKTENPQTSENGTQSEPPADEEYELAEEPLPESEEPGAETSKPAKQ